MNICHIYKHEPNCKTTYLISFDHIFQYNQRLFSHETEVWRNIQEVWSSGSSRPAINFLRIMSITFERKFSEWLTNHFLYCFPSSLPIFWVSMTLSWPFHHNDFSMICESLEFFSFPHSAATSAYLSTFH